VADRAAVGAYPPRLRRGCGGLARLAALGGRELPRRKPVTRKPFPARYEGDCPRCGGKIAPGEIITGIRNAWFHVDCPEPADVDIDALISELLAGT
jgi:hypothetical protein